MLRFSTFRITHLATVLAITLFGTAVWSACHRSVTLPAELLAVAGRLPEKVDYNLHVKPILSDRCFACHGPDKAKQKAGLRLDTPEGAYKALAESGKTAIVPGDLNRSEVFHRITSTDPDVMMPTPTSNLSLNAEEKAILVRWIEQGAEYKPHWSLVTPVADKVPDVKETSWPKNDIDRFVLSKLEAKGLKHAPEADKITLLRRVTLDLTGLPPTPAEINAFLADPSPDAYEKVVDRLLANPHYGEKQAAGWLDVARYADTHGYQDDGMRTVWPYRDWVIKAFNQNLPYSTFITWQLAGDLIPAPTGPDPTRRDRLIATAFNRNHQQSQEGGIVDEEYRVEYVADRANTFGKAMLGLTVECARCHDHKYDPISQKDYYSLFAFFNSNNDRGQVPYNGEAAPTITLPDSEAEAKLKFIREKLTPVARQLNLNQPGYQQRYNAWLARTEHNPTPPAPTGLIAHYTFDEPDRMDIRAYVKTENEKRKREEAERKQAEKTKKATPKKTEKPTVATRKTKAELIKDPRNAFWNTVNDTLPARLGGDPDKYPYAVAGRFGKARFLPGDSFIELPYTFGAFEQNQPFTISSWFNLTGPRTAATLLGRTTGPMDGQRGYQLDLTDDGRLKLTLNHVWPDNALDIESIDKVPMHQWFQVAFTYNGMGRANGLTLYLNGQPMRVRVITDNLQHSMVYGMHQSHWAQHSFYVGRMHDYFYKNIAVDELRIYDRCLTPLELPALAGKPDALTQALRTPAVQRTPAQRAGLYTYYVTAQDSAYHQAFKNAMQLRGEQIQVLTDSRQVMVMKERSQPRKTFILQRGAYDMHGPEVTPATPAQLAPFPENLPKNRLGLAQWLLRPDHTLFSRVAVNRFWQQYFGTGLVASTDDFGNQGALPTHLELLDYLAVRFREGSRLAGQPPITPWNVKALQKLIVMSATYRQSSAVSAKAREADWDNALLSRGPSYRMSAEQVRDIALTASGLLNPQIGGPSVYPYQPAGIWEALATRNAVVYTQSHGDSLYRRSLYTIWKRSSPPPMMLDFDASERALCTVKRQKTSTPLQALVTLNDPQFVEAARVLAQNAPQAMKSEKTTPTQAAGVINYFFKSIISRPARPQEATLLQQLYAEELADFRQHPKRATELLRVGEYPVDNTRDPRELAAWTVVASTVLNFDEAIIKR